MMRLRSWAAAALAATALLLPAGASAQQHWRSDYFPNVPLVTQDGKTIHFYDDVLHDKVVAINFIFTSCTDVCPLDTAQLRRVQTLLGDRIGRDIFMYSITVDPTKDKPAVLRDYMSRFDIGPGWTFLTGSIEDIGEIQRKLGLIVADNNDPRDHATTVILANEATGQWIKRSPYDNPQVIADLLTGQLTAHSLTGGASSQRLSYADADQFASMSRGESLFRTRCVTCHSIGGGDGLGPDLLDVGSRRSRDWLVRWIKEPDVMLAEGDPIATPQLARYRKLVMPNLKLNDTEATALLAFIAAETRLAAAAAPASGHDAHTHH